MRPRPAVALIDGEHYPPVVVDTLVSAADRYEFRAAVFLGGSEKIREGSPQCADESVYGLPVVRGADWSEGLRTAIARFSPEVVVDLSDEPVLGYKERFRLISRCLAEGVTYVGSDFHFDPVGLAHLCAAPSLSIVGTGKRVGKTAVSGYMARTFKELARSAGGVGETVVVAMGRGGPSRPEVIDGASVALTVADLVGWSLDGRHAASDCYEDAVLSRVVTVGCRRCGGGMAGEPFASNVREGVEIANALQPGFLILEGSGASLPPIATDARLLVCGAQQPVEYIAGYLGEYRLLTSDAVIVTMAERPPVSEKRVRAVMAAAAEVKRDLTVIPTVLRPLPAAPIEGRKVAFFTTAPASQAATLRGYLEERFGCRVIYVSSNLSDRAALRADLDCEVMLKADTILTEIKAAAIDVVAETATARGVDVVFVDNVPLEVAPAAPGDLRSLAECLFHTATRRFRTQA